MNGLKTDEDGIEIGDKTTDKDDLNETKIDKNDNKIDRAKARQ